MRVVAVIPARYGSSRFPGKPLTPVLGRPLIAWVVDAARRATRVAEVLVATDHDGIAAAAREAGARAVMTPPDCPSGTDRVAVTARSVAADVYVNLQGDEPLLDPRDVDALARVFDHEPDTRMATLSRPLADPSELACPDVVKVVCDGSGHALYFSRAPIPYFRDAWGPAGPGPVPPGGVEPLKHLGVYAYRRDALLEFAQLPEGRLEAAERLEQLRALEAGWRIRVLPARTDSVGVDRPGDVARVEALLRARG